MEVGGIRFKHIIDVQLANFEFMSYSSKRVDSDNQKFDSDIFMFWLLFSGDKIFLF